MRSAPIRQWLRRLFRLDESDPAESHLERGKALCARGDHAQGVEAYQRAIDADPDDAEAHYRTGIAWRDQEQFASAVASYHRALAIKPDYIEAHNNLGVVFQLQNDLPAAQSCYRRAVELNPDFSQPYINLGRLCEMMGTRAEAAQCYRQAIAANVEPETFRHFLDAAEGVMTGRAPAAYARTVFDNFAEQFDHRLVADLGYRIPQILGERVLELCASRQLRVLDLGCGTGLCAQHLKPSASSMIGVDVSPAMLAKAGTLKLYDELIEQDITDYLTAAAPASFDLVLAADVFVYIGDLAQVFNETARVLDNEGLFAFSVERTEEARDFMLQPNGRYVQSAAYIQRIAAESGFAELVSFEETIRGAPGHGAPGLVFILRKKPQKSSTL
ncbi:MAG: methyltransferase [Betaproteobacteria bacterium]|nr:methyltransferase [Betaproteobacteria bacterium]